MSGDEQPPVLSRGVGAPTKCKSCPQKIVFAHSYTTGKKMPLQLDDKGEWILENGYAKHAGPVPAQPDLFASGPAPQRYTSHHAVCPAADEWRKK